jgi:predicted S18 family serine protease
MTDEVAKDANMVQEISAINRLWLNTANKEATDHRIKAQVLELGKQPASKPIATKPTAVQLGSVFSSLINKINNN